MPENESEEGLKGRLKRLEGPESSERSEITETEGEQEDPKQGAVNLLLEGKSSVADIAAQTGLSASVVGGLKSQLLKKGYLTSEKPEEGSPQEAQRPLSAEEQMRKEATRTLKEELSTAPGCSEQSMSWVLRRFERDSGLASNPNQLHTLLRNTCPRMDDFIIEQVVDEVLKTVESFHLERVRAPFPNYNTREQGYRGYVDYDHGQTHPTYGSQEERFYTGTDFANERRLWGIENRVEKLDSGLESINKGLEDLNKKLETPKTPLDDGSVSKLGEKIEKLEADLKAKDRELDEKDKARLREELGELKDEIKGLRNNLGEWKTDEFKLIGEGFGKLTDFGREVLKEAPLSKAVQNVATAMMPQGSREVPPEARETVLSLLKREGLTVAE